MQAEIEALGRRAAKQEVEGLIQRVCSRKPMTIQDLAAVFSRDSEHLRSRYLSSMVERGDLEYLYPEYPRHSKQAYLAKIGRGWGYKK